MSENHRYLIKKPFVVLPTWITNMHVRAVVRVNTVMLKIIIEPNEPGKRDMNLSIRLSAVLSRRNIFLRLMPVFKAQCSPYYCAGYNVVDVKVTLYDGSYHEVDSSEMAFKIAASMAFKEAMKKADPVLTEPIMKVVVVTPDDYMGDVIGDLNSAADRFKVWNRCPADSRLQLWCRCLKCSDMQPILVPEHRDAVSIPWSLRTLGSSGSRFRNKLFLRAQRTESYYF